MGAAGAPAVVAFGLLLSAIPAGRPAAAGTPDPIPSPAAPARPFRVRLQGLAPPVAEAVAGIPGVALAAADGDCDLRIVYDELGFKLLLPSGDEIAAYGPDGLAEVLKRVSRQVAVQGLIDLTFPHQDFAVTLEVPGNPGALTEGEAFTIEFSVERDSHILLVDIDSDGYVSLLYPFDAQEARAVRHGRVPASGALRVSAPFGTDHLKLVAFQEKPPGFDAWLGSNDRRFAPMGPEIAALLRLIAGATGSKAQAGLKVRTRGPCG
jgi:hypothetical protein